MPALIGIIFALALGAWIALATLSHISVDKTLSVAEIRQVEAGFRGFIQAGRVIEETGAAHPNSVDALLNEVQMSLPPLPGSGTWTLLSSGGSVTVCAVISAEANGAELLKKTADRFSSVATNLGGRCGLGGSSPSLGIVILPARH